LLLFPRLAVLYDGARREIKLKAFGDNPVGTDTLRAVIEEVVANDELKMLLPPPPPMLWSRAIHTGTKEELQQPR
jgi:hypothetical protein